MPVPMGLVRISRSPTLPPEFLRIFFGCTSPVTAIPYFGSGDWIECPPRTGMPASRALSAPPARIAFSIRIGSSFGNATMFSAKIARAPMAQMSLIAFAAAICP